MCKNCNKALCKECAVILPFGASCKGICENEAKAVHELVEFNVKRYKQLRGYPRILTFIIFFLISIFVVFIIRFSSSKKSAESNSADSYSEDFQHKIESGIYNTTVLDTMLIKSRKIYFNNDFNELSCSRLIKQLFLISERDDKNDIDLFLCSSGGYISEAKAVINTFRSIKPRVNTIASGYCGSAALLTLANGTGVRSAFENTILMFHGADYSRAGTPNSYDAISKEIDIKEWKSVSKLPEKMISDTTEMNFSPEKALEYGLIDKVITYPPRIPVAK